MCLFNALMVRKKMFKFKNQKIRISLLVFGLEINTKTKMLTLVRFFGIKIYKRENDFFKIFGFKFYLNNDNDSMRILCKELRDVPDRFVINLTTTPSGELFLFMQNFHKFCINNKIGSEVVIVVDSVWKKRLCEFLNPGINIKQIEGRFYTYSLFCAKMLNKRIYNIFPTRHYLNQDKFLLKGKGHYYDYICKTMKVTKEKLLPLKPRVFAKEVVDRWLFQNNISVEKLIVICPEANTCSSISNMFWQELINKINNGGGYV